MVLPQGITGSTMPRRQLGRRLRDLRNRARMTTRVAAQRLEWSEAKIWRIETGQTSLRGLDVEAMCKIYGAPAELVAPLTALARETKARGWWTEYGDVIAEGFEVYVGLEEAAHRLSTYENELVPGLLQTEAYTRAVLAGARPDMSSTEADRRVAVRAARQALLTRAEEPVRLDAVITASMLRRRIGGSDVARGQLEHLLAMCDRPNIEIRLVPDDSGYHDGLESGRFVLVEFDSPAGEPPEPPVVYVETFTGSAYFDKEAEIDRYRAAFASIKAVAVDAREAVETALAHA
ncbi:helix-turn-helix domain-containing protein [Nocardia sp. CDC159]|uniref:Helix-turn-helix domain-containing protein n=1 Tax=Nocardia pulmonis TaxID=2951408 RepID=A0A9X2E9L7_9NOCA|nr:MULTISPECIES: helix-turn-helix transcriptional regulator [Nocardia]MCM6776832.1 helix-turn-helix domain-containing protein [Nocardia pulmonis]MCM6789256.1 helix-turn-helix domain-containing protein [Nocardia sp. CDC159]